MDSHITTLSSSWRPLNIVKNAPLVISDRRTVLQDDLLEVEKVLPDKVERNFYVKYKPYHKWFYMSDQGPEDVAIFTSWEEKNGSETAGQVLTSYTVEKVSHTHF